jgi:signal transduction histidine kinase/HAMP domain-containing protein
MKKEISLKKHIQNILISFSIFITIAISLLSIINFYFSKLTIIEHNQKQILFQIESEVKKFLTQIYNISLYIKNNYKDNNSLLKNIVETNTNISSILVLDDSGVIKDFYATTNLNIYKGFDYSKQNYFLGLKKGKSDYWSNVFLSTVDEEPAISYSFKFDNKVVVLMIRLKEISEFISRFKNQNDTHMVKIFDENGILVLNPNNPDLVLQRFNEKTKEVFTKLIDKLPSYYFTIFNSSLNNENLYGTYTTIQKTDWKIVVSESYDLILKSLSGIVLVMFLSMLIFILLAISLSLKISKRIFNSFDELQKTTTNISNGNYDINIKDSYYNEFNLLLNSFNKMKIEIDKREESLEASLDSFKSLFNSTMEIMIIHDKGICVDANNVAIKFLQLNNKDELLGKNLLEFVDENYKELLIKNYEKNTLPYEFEIVINNQKFTCLGQGKFLKLNGRVVKLSTLIDITELKDKDKLLSQQSKMAAMGEMIENIAHQWRQPLSLISTCASGIKFEKEFNKTISDERLVESLNLIVDNTQYLSKTIDDFRNFFKADKNIENYCVNKSINKVLNLLKSSIENHNIKIETKNIENLIINGYPNEFLQVIINILNNSKDALLNQDKNKRFIDINTYIKNKKCFVEISDNGGGVEDEVISKVFEPYFTTKHKSQGTGIGLYMSHQIIVEHMKGGIDIKNMDFIKNDEVYKGCMVILEIPINEKYNLDFHI